MTWPNEKPRRNAQLMRCVQCMGSWPEGERRSLADIARFFGLTRQRLYYLVKIWRRRQG